MTTPMQGFTRIQDHVYTDYPYFDPLIALLFMNLLFKRHYTPFLNPKLKLNKNPSPQTQIIELSNSGSLLQALQLLNSTHSSQISIKANLYASLLQSCSKIHSLKHGTNIHSQIIKLGLESDRFVGNSLLAMYLKCCDFFAETRRVFDSLVFKDIISWTSMISGYVKIGKPDEAIALFKKMENLSLEPNAFTISAMIKACSENGDIRLGRHFHRVSIQMGFDSNCIITSALIVMYGRIGSLEDAHQVFDEMPQPDTICWTSIISAYTQNDRYEEALCCFFSMQGSCGISADGFTLGTALTACGNLGRVEQGRQIHARIITSGIEVTVITESCIVDMYGKCGFVEDSHRVFDRMVVKNSVSWCALLGGYCQNGHGEVVLDLFRQMEPLREKDHYSLGTVLRACASLPALRQGKEIHCHFLRTGTSRNLIVESALVDLYAKCGNIDYAQRVFVEIPEKNLITWNSMIGGFAQNGRGEDGVELFKGMIKEGIWPDYITFIEVLFACAHCGLVCEGRRYFVSMDKDYGISAGIEHYACMVDLLGRAGLLEEAEDLITNAVYRDDSSLWTALLGACATHLNVGLAERAATKIMELEPDSHLSYVLLSNIYAKAGCWGDASMVRKLMKGRGIRKTAGKSWIELKNDMNSYIDYDDLSLLKEPNCLSQP